MGDCEGEGEGTRSGRLRGRSKKGWEIVREKGEGRRGGRLRGRREKGEGVGIAREKEEGVGDCEGEGKREKGEEVGDCEGEGKRGGRL